MPGASRSTLYYVFVGMSQIAKKNGRSIVISKVGGRFSLQSTTDAQRSIKLLASLFIASASARGGDHRSVVRIFSLICAVRGLGAAK